jgi:hypothetical protein
MVRGEPPGTDCLPASGEMVIIRGAARPKAIPALMITPKMRNRKSTRRAFMGEIITEMSYLSLENVVQYGDMQSEDERPAL